jgi:adenosyl cobinamide kinase/adenosyl cobinamide phosphate guanylyltransferase
MKGLIGYNGNNQLIQSIDLAYHTVLQFNFGSFKGVRGYLDTLVVGESRVGKSSTAETLRKAYGLGVFTSLAGNSATVPGLVGGSNKTANGFQTRAGIIPQNHRGLIIFEEFGKSNINIIKELTDIRSSNEVRIARVSGTITLPAMVRMISLSNVRSTDGTIKPIASYPNGISVVTELVETAEDIARYDLLVILADKGASEIDPFWEPKQPFSEQVYKDRVRWIWSRTADQIHISREVGLYVMAKANELNREYECHIKIFGTECWKKVCRLAIAVAGYLVSATDDYTGILVTKEHIDYAVDFLRRIYDNQTFKLKEYVQHEKQYTKIDDEGVYLLQDLYNKHPGLVLQLEQCATANKNMLGGATGLNNDDLNKALQSLTKGLFIRFSNHEIIPTERFRLGLAKINRHTFVQRLGEPDAAV